MLIGSGQWSELAGQHTFALLLPVTSFSCCTVIIHPPIVKSGLVRLVNLPIRSCVVCDCCSLFLAGKKNYTLDSHWQCSANYSHWDGNWVHTLLNPDPDHTFYLSYQFGYHTIHWLCATCIHLLGLHEAWLNTTGTISSTCPTTSLPMVPMHLGLNDSGSPAIQNDKVEDPWPLYITCPKIPYKRFIRQPTPPVCRRKGSINRNVVGDHEEYYGIGVWTLRNQKKHIGLIIPELCSKFLPRRQWPTRKVFFLLKELVLRPGQHLSTSHLSAWSQLGPSWVSVRQVGQPWCLAGWEVEIPAGKLMMVWSPSKLDGLQRFQTVCNDGCLRIWPSRTSQLLTMGWCFRSQAW